MKRILCVFALALSAIPAVSQQSPEKPAGAARAEVLVLGAYAATCAYSPTSCSSPTQNERILVIYGTGHLGWLRLAVASDPKLRLSKLAELAR